MKSPHDRLAEWTVLGEMLSNPKTIGEVVGAQVEPEDFFQRDCQLIYSTAVEMHYADDHVDAVTVADRLRVPLATIWQCDENEVGTRLYQQVMNKPWTDNIVDHAKTVRRYGDLRRIEAVANGALQAISEGDLTPEEIGDRMTTEASRITAGAAKRAEVLDWMEVGREYLGMLRGQMRAAAAGVKLGVYTELPFIDNYTKGIKPTELWMLGGEPGVGKSALSWAAAEGFARAQAQQPKDRQVGTLVLSMEMGIEPSSTRLAQSLTGLDGGRLREGQISDDEYKGLVMAWKKLEDLPLYFNFAPNFRMSQMRALIVEAIRKYNVGFVVIDHFRMFDPDRKVNNPLQEDETKVRFLKESIAKDLNVAVCCLAHTVKIRRESSDGRPTLADLRGSYQVAAHCDIVSFMYRPIMYATDNEINEGVVSPTDAEVIHAKNRNGGLGAQPFLFDPARMVVRRKW